MICGNPRCNKVRTKICSACLNEGYCDSACQKIDWKIHKIMCISMKNTDKLKSFKEVDATLIKLKEQIELRKEGKDGEIRLLEYSLLFAEYQYGDRIVGQLYRKREVNGIDKLNFHVDILTLLRLCIQLGASYIAIATKIENKAAHEDAIHKAIYYHEKSRSILEPWQKQVNSEKGERIDKIDEMGIDIVYNCMSEVEKGFGECYRYLDNNEKAGDYYDKAIAHAKRIKGDRRTYLLCDMLLKKSHILDL